MNRKDYLEYLNSPRWKQKANEARKRAGYKCQVCSSKKKLDVHHNNYMSLGYEDYTDLVVLCRECHGLFHRKVVPIHKDKIRPIGILTILVRSSGDVNRDFLRKRRLQGLCLSYPGTDVFKILDGDGKIDGIGTTEMNEELTKRLSSLVGDENFTFVSKEVPYGQSER